MSETVVVTHYEPFVGSKELKAGEKRDIQLKARVHFSIKNTSPTASIHVGWKPEDK